MVHGLLSSKFMASNVCVDFPMLALYTNPNMSHPLSELRMNLSNLGVKGKNKRVLSKYVVGCFEVYLVARHEGRKGYASTSIPFPFMTWPVDPVAATKTALRSVWSHPTFESGVKIARWIREYVTVDLITNFWW